MRASAHIRRWNDAAGVRARGFDLRGAIITFAAFFAIFTQTFVVQTHVDFAPLDPAAAAASHNPSASLTPAHTELRAGLKGAGDSGAPCPICQTLATAGAAVIASTTTLNTASRPFIAAFEVRLPLISVRAAHSWQSRAPPLPL